MSWRWALLMLAAAAAACAQNNGGTGSDEPEASGQSLNAAEPLPDDTAQAEKADWTARYDQMSAVLQLSDEETVALQAALKAGDEAIANWQAEHGARLARLERDMADAARSRDLNALRQFKSQAKPLRDEFLELVEAQQVNIRQSLSAGNRTLWQAHLLSEKMLELTEPLTLTEAQVSELRTKAVAAVRQTVDELNPRAAAYLRLEEAVESQVLTADQKAIFEELKTKNPLRTLR